MANEHAPLGTKPYQCSHGDCTQSFSTNQKLRSHLKVHEGMASYSTSIINLTPFKEKRYTCVNPACTSAPESAFYPTWTALQYHIRTVHPPICPHEECVGRVFSSQKGLRAHLKLHEERALEDVLSEHEDHSSEEDAPPRKRRRGGELGRDWKCEVEGCTKDFKSVRFATAHVMLLILTPQFRQKKTLTTHHAITHLGQRDFVCVVEGCGRAFGYKHILQRHQARRHSDDLAKATEDEEPSDVERPQSKKRRAQSPDTSIINEITGVAYEERAARMHAPLTCPYPAMEGLPSAPPAEGWGDAAPCEYVFGRAYDLRRHLGAVHSVVLEKEVVESWARSHTLRPGRPTIRFY